MTCKDANFRFRGLSLSAALAVLLALSPASQATGKAGATRALTVVEVEIPGQSGPVELYADSYALVIGAAEYNNGWPRLPGVVGDVEAVGKALEEHGFNVTRVNNPDSETLERSIKRFVSSHGLRRHNRLLIYFAGHGHTLKPDADRQLGYLVPVDAPLADRDPGGFKERALSMEMVESYAKQIESKHALFIFDSCFSGSFFKMRAAPEVIALKTTQPVRQFITSGGADQQVPDESVFRRQFIAGLEGEADVNGDGYLTASELGGFLEEKVTNYSNRTQTPQYGKIRDPALDKGDFVFVLKRDKPLRQAEPERVVAAIPNSSANTALRTQQASLNPDVYLPATRQPQQSLEPSPAPLSLATPPQPRQQPAHAASSRYQAGQILRDCPGCPEMLVVPAGSFDMGSKDGPPDQRPVRRVTIPAPFALARTEITQAQWREVMGENPSQFKDCGDNCPVERISWLDAQEFVKQLSERTGQQYRLPSEAEWEYACRANRRQNFCGGNDVDSIAWHARNSAGGFFSKKPGAREVAQKQANAWGLHDMSGNVWEWVEDCHKDDYRGAPVNGNSANDGDCDRRVLRGGSWYNDPPLSRATFRSAQPESASHSYFGLRPLRVLAP
jgi:formylglycine-generating enzyme required for sulfatase activity